MEREAHVANRTRKTLSEKEGNLRDQLKAAAISSLKRNKSSPSPVMEEDDVDDDEQGTDMDERSDRDSEGGTGFPSSSKSEGATGPPNEEGISSTPVGRKVIRRDSATKDAAAGDGTSDNGTDEETSGNVDPSILQKAYREMSAKERKLYDQYNTDAGHGDGTKAQLSLPPIEPQTPNVGQARKILLRGADLANKVSQASPASSPSHSVGLYSNASSPMHLQSPKGHFTNRNSSSVGGGAGPGPDDFLIGSPTLASSRSEESLSSPLINPPGGRKIPLSALAEAKEEEKEGSRRASSDSVPAAKLGAGAKADNSDSKEGKDEEWDD